jgi:hypothetical protein
MPAVELAQRGRHQSGVGQAGGRIFLGMAGDRAGLRHRRLQAVLAQVGGAGAALARAEVDGDGDAAVAGGLDRFHLAHAHVDGKPAVLVAADLGLAGTGGAGCGQQLLGDTRRAAACARGCRRRPGRFRMFNGSLFNGLSCVDAWTRRRHRRIPEPQPQPEPARCAGRAGAGRTLTALSAAQLARLPIPEELLPHIRETQRITSHRGAQAATRVPGQADAPPGRRGAGRDPRRAGQGRRRRPPRDRRPASRGSAARRPDGRRRRRGDDRPAGRASRCRPPEAAPAGAQRARGTQAQQAAARVPGAVPRAARTGWRRTDGDEVADPARG